MNLKQWRTKMQFKIIEIKADDNDDKFNVLVETEDKKLFLYQNIIMNMNSETNELEVSYTVTKKIPDSNEIFELKNFTEEEKQISEEILNSIFQAVIKNLEDLFAQEKKENENESV